MQRLGGLLDQMGNAPGGRALQLLNPGQDATLAGARGLELPPLRWSDQLGGAAPSAPQRTRMPGWRRARAPARRCRAGLSRRRGWRPAPCLR
jgi:hypothetical protein